MKKYFLETIGCQMNEHDSEKISYVLEEMGYIRSYNKEESDLILINTCLIRENAENKIYGQLGALKNLKRINKDLILGVCGCMVQPDAIRDHILKKYPQVDIIFGPRNIQQLPELIHQHLSTGKTVMDTDIMAPIEQDMGYLRGSDVSAYVNIIYGCNNFCSYCVVPYTRGREESREIDAIYAETERLIEQGYKEITLLGQNVNSYGKTLAQKSTFADLLRRLHEIEGLERIRFMTSHPKDLSDELIDVIADSNKICKHIHLPMQSGSTRILELMNRKYTKNQYLNLIQRIKNKIPQVSLSTDIIVGFPTETEEDFDDTLDVVKQVGFDQGYTFLYSRRTDTPAAEFTDQIPDDVKKNRFNRLLDTMYPIFYEKNAACVGGEYEVLVEGFSKNRPDILTGRTDSFKLTHFPGDASLIGKIVRVKIVNNNTFALEGILC